MDAPKTGQHWLDLYASNVHDWHTVQHGDTRIYHRRQGIVENLFDSDGIDFEGRADIHAHLLVRVKMRLNAKELQRRLLLVWAYMRQQHVLLSSRSLFTSDFLPNTGKGRRWIDKSFVYELPRDGAQAIRDAQQSIVFVEEAYHSVDPQELYLHLMNTTRAVDPHRYLSKLFVLPPARSGNGYATISFILVAAHQIADGLTVFRWSSHLTELLNWSREQLLEGLDAAISNKDVLQARLPPAQEAIYPHLGDNVARSRWKWGFSRVLRHVRRPPAAAFQNPLRRQTPTGGADELPALYPKILDYSRKPPLNCFHISADFSQRATHNLIRICREAGISIGSGCFALVGLVMMRFEELRHPQTPYWERLPFVGSFPINPRPFLSGTPTTGKEDSLMLAFSDGITLPFVPSHCDLRNSLRVLGRLAHRQLRQHQKRPPSVDLEQGAQHLGSRSPTQRLPALYLTTLERLDKKVRPEQRVGFNPQGAYPASTSSSLATCGISSVGDRTSLISAGKYDLDDLGDKDLAADFVSLNTVVRARDGEFLVGASGTKDHLGFMVSYDGSAIDPMKARIWKSVMEIILDYDMEQTVTSRKPRL